MHESRNKPESPNETRADEIDSSLRDEVIGSAAKAVDPRLKPRSAVDELIDVLFSDEAVFAAHVIGTADLVGGHLPGCKVRARLDEIFENGPRILSDPEARELLDADPEAFAFLRLKIQINASELSAPWIEEVGKRIRLRDAVRPRTLRG